MAKVLKIKATKPERWEDALQEFLLWKQATGVRERTLSDYKLHVSMFFKRYPEAFQNDKLKRNVLEYMGQPIKANTFNLRLEYLRAFFRWSVNQGIIYTNPLADIKKRKDENRIVNIDKEILTQLLQLPQVDTFAGLRDYALLLLFLDTGIRPKEAFSLLKEDINLRSLEIYIRSDCSKT